LADPGTNYEVSVWVRFAFAPADGRAPWTQPRGDSMLGGGRQDGRWSLHVCEKLGEDADGLPIAGETVLDLDGQDAGPDQLALLRALLSGGTASTPPANPPTPPDANPGAFSCAA
jgi:hypothetical protein